MHPERLRTVVHDGHTGHGVCAERAQAGDIPGTDCHEAHAERRGHIADTPGEGHLRKDAERQCRLRRDNRKDSGRPEPYEQRTAASGQEQTADCRCHARQLQHGRAGSKPIQRRACVGEPVMDKHLRRERRRIPEDAGGDERLDAAGHGHDVQQPPETAEPQPEESVGT